MSTTSRRPRRVVTWTDDSGPHSSRPMSLPEAAELARSLRMHGAQRVAEVNPDRTPPPEPATV
jgi:hypothetical protein